MTFSPTARKNFSVSWFRPWVCNIRSKHHLLWLGTEGEANEWYSQSSVAAYHFLYIIVSTDSLLMIGLSSKITNQHY